MRFIAYYSVLIMYDFIVAIIYILNNVMYYYVLFIYI